MAKATTKPTTDRNFEATLWAAADKLRGTLDAAEYKHVVLGLIFLKYISDAFEERRAELERLSRDADSDLYVKDDAQREHLLEDKDEYASVNIFWVPPKARWSELQDNAKKPHIAAVSLHTMYLDKPMRGHGLMQAIARVNRVFRDKPGGLVVDLLGIAEPLKEAMAQYTATKRAGQPTLDQDEAVDELRRRHEILRQFFHGFDDSKYATGDDNRRLQTLVAAVEFVLAQENGKDRFLQELTGLSQAFALSVPRPEALALRDDIVFYQAIRSQLLKHTVTRKATQAHDSAIRQLVSEAISGYGIIDIFQAAGLPSPSVGILDDDFLREIQALPQKNLALEALRRLLNDEIKLRSRKNIVEARSFRELLERAIVRYQNMAINAAQVIEEMIELARRLKESAARGEKLGLMDDEVAFYDALAHHQSAREVLGDENLYLIAREVAKSIRANVSIDWTIKESVRAKLRTAVKRVLRKYGYPPDKQESATDLVLQQAELLCAELAI